MSTPEFHALLRTNRELKMRCLELAATLCRPNTNPEDIMGYADRLYKALPLDAEASYSGKAAAKAVKNGLGRESAPADTGQ